ncbi:hypothetical protein Taro_005987, partial [Colocasia esculenta]|nr:hypothetical protein [Colocasia esculenta]
LLRPLPRNLSLSLALAASQPRWKRAVTSCQIVQFCFSSSMPERLKASTASTGTPPLAGLAPHLRSSSARHCILTIAATATAVAFFTVATKEASFSPDILAFSNKSGNGAGSLS